MLSRKLTALAMAPTLAGLALVANATTQDTPEPPAEAATPAVTIETLKQRVGDWYLVGPDGEATDELISQMRITAGGNAVMEILFPDQDFEMLTVYYMDGDRLTLTHYCAVGAHPEMLCNPESTPGRLVFDCNGGANILDADTGHMHHAVIEWDGKDRMTSAWDFYANGEKQNTANFDLMRKAPEPEQDQGDQR